MKPNVCRKQLSSKVSATIAATLASMRSAFSRVEIDNPGLEARLILAHVLSCSQEQLLAHPNQLLEQDATTHVEQLLQRRLANEPLAYLLESKEFWGLPFIVSPATLIPRPDTEALIETVLSNFPDRAAPLNFLDLGTGSGCIALSILHEYPNARAVAVDRSINALKVAKRNAHKLELAKRIDFLLGYWCQGLAYECDLVVSNPPYITLESYQTLAPEVKIYEPQSALVAGEDGNDCYRELIPDAYRCLKMAGLLILECGLDQHLQIADLMKTSGFSSSTFYHDATSRIRGLVASKSSTTNI